MFVCCVACVRVYARARESHVVVCCVACVCESERKSCGCMLRCECMRERETVMHGRAQGYTYLPLSVYTGMRVSVCICMCVCMHICICVCVGAIACRLTCRLHRRAASTCLIHVHTSMQPAPASTWASTWALFRCSGSIWRGGGGAST